MKIVIVEDEALAAERLSLLIQACQADVEILAILDAVEEAVQWFKKEAAPDLAFFDIQLADGISFDIFNQCTVDCPVIFTTAFDEYALQAFKVNSIDYLLKPVEKKQLAKAIDKYKNLYQKSTPQTIDPTAIEAVMKMMGQKQSYKSRFVTRSGHKLLSIATDDILYFFSEQKLSRMMTNEAKKYTVDFKMEELQSLLNPEQFFRINRQYIISMESIKSITDFTNGRYKIQLVNPNNEEPIVVSRERASNFKSWLDQ